MEYEIELSMYGTMAYRETVTIEADNEDEAREEALDMANRGELEFTDDGECVDGWEFQVENCEAKEEDE